jgi:hypothetical protein
MGDMVIKGRNKSQAFPHPPVKSKPLFTGDLSRWRGVDVSGFFAIQ